MYAQGGPGRLPRRPPLLPGRGRPSRPRRPDRHDALPALPPDGRVRLLLHARGHPGDRGADPGRPPHDHEGARPLPDERAPRALPHVPPAGPRRDPRGQALTSRHFRRARSELSRSQSLTLRRRGSSRSAPGRPGPGGAAPARDAGEARARDRAPAGARRPTARRFASGPGRSGGRRAMPPGHRRRRPGRDEGLHRPDPRGRRVGAPGAPRPGLGRRPRTPSAPRSSTSSSRTTTTWRSGRGAHASPAGPPEAVTALPPGVGVAADVGLGHHMEDRWAVQATPGGLFAAVYDGHGGARVADRAAAELHLAVLARPAGRPRSGRRPPPGVRRAGGGDGRRRLRLDGRGAPADRGRR